MSDKKYGHTNAHFHACVTCSVTEVLLKIINYKLPLNISMVWCKIVGIKKRYHNLYQALDIYTLGKRLEFAHQIYFYMFKNAKYDTGKTDFDTDLGHWKYTFTKK